MKRRLILAALPILLILLSLTGACNNEVEKSSVTSIPVKENAAQVTENDILLKLSTNKDKYIPGEVVLVTASVENLSSNSITYALSSAGLPVPGVYLENNPYFSGFALEEKELGGGRTTIPIYTTGKLKPHEIVKREVVWNQKIFPDNQQAPQATYSIACVVNLGDYLNQSSLKLIKVNLEINIVGAPKWITPDEAKTIALNLPEVKAWQETHSGKRLIKQENGNYYIFEMGGWQQIAPQFSMSEQGEQLTLDNYQTWVPEVNVIFENGKWMITTGTKLGPDPHFVTIFVDPKMGSHDVRFSLYDSPMSR